MQAIVLYFRHIYFFYLSIVYCLKYFFIYSINIMPSSRYSWSALQLSSRLHIRFWHPQNHRVFENRLWILPVPRSKGSCIHISQFSFTVFRLESWANIPVSLWRFSVCFSRGSASSLVDFQFFFWQFESTLCIYGLVLGSFFLLVFWFLRSALELC